MSVIPVARTLAQRFLLLVVVLIAWQLIAGWVDSQSVPSIAPTWSAATGLLGGAAYWSAVGATLQSWAIGLGVASAIGVPLGLIVGSSAVTMRLTRGVVEFLRTLPSIMLVPLVVLVFGSTVRMKVILIVLAAVWPLMLQAAYGAREIDRLARESVRAFHVPWGLRVLHLFLPSAAPLIATGLRVAATIGLLISVGAEIITSAPGIGDEIAIGQTNGDSARAWVYILTAGALGVGINLLLALGERRVLFWHASQRAATR